MSELFRNPLRIEMSQVDCYNYYRCLAEVVKLYGQSAAVRFMIPLDLYGQGVRV